MKKFYVVVIGHIGRLLDPEKDCQIAKSEKDAISICKNTPDPYKDDVGYLEVITNKNVSPLIIKKLALAQIW